MNVEIEVRPVIKFDCVNDLLETWFWDEAQKWFTNSASYPGIVPLYTVSYVRNITRIPATTLDDELEIPRKEYTVVRLIAGKEHIAIQVDQALFKVNADAAREAIANGVKALRSYLNKP